MKIPTDKTTLSVFLRDYDGRSRKTRGQKIEIMKKILDTGTISLDGEEHKLSDDEYELILHLYHKYVLGKWASEITEEKVLKVFELKEAKNGRTIRDISTSLGCTDESVRTKIEKLVNSGKLIRSTNPENKRQGLFFLKSKRVGEVVA